MIKRTLGAKARPDNYFSRDGDVWTVKSVSTFKTHIFKFKLGEPFDMETPDGRVMKVRLWNIVFL